MKLNTKLVNKDKKKIDKARKRFIKYAVNKVIKEYGKTLKMLMKE